jgi:uncharacterized SAM-binding protein YcdF (DUF218 family)
MKNKSKFTVFLYRVLSALFVMLGMSFSERRCRKFYEQSKDKVFDVLIVPGVPFKGTRWDLIMKSRVIWASLLYKQGIVKNIIFSGAAVHSSFYESDVMRAYAIALGVPEAHVIPERLAEHSTENVYYSYRLALKLQKKSMALASDPFQTRMLRKFTFRKVDPGIALLPLVYGMVNEVDRQMADPVIDFDALRIKDFVPLKERESLGKRLKGTSGSRIDREVYPIHEDIRN